jgi:prenyltransferase beta subunit
MRRALFLAVILPLPLAAQGADERQATLRFLSSLQRPDGGFVTALQDPKADGKPMSSLRATSAAVRAIKYLGGGVPNKEKATEFVMACHDSEGGGFANRPKDKPDVTSTAVGLMAIAEFDRRRLPPVAVGRSILFLAENAETFEERRLAAAGMEAAGAFPPRLKEWFAEIRKTANPDGTYGKGDGQARETGSVIAMFLRAGEKLPEAERNAAITALQAGQRPDGGFGKAGEKGSDGETTYRVMRAFHLLKEKPKDVEKLKEFFGKCHNADGGYGVAPGQPSTVSGTYYVAAVGMWLKD